MVRRGTAQVVTDAGSSRVRADEQAVIDDHAPDRRADVREAGAFDSLERWGRQLDDEYASVDPGSDVDDNLRYQAAPLARYGAWITIDGGRYWHPRVDAAWRPYWQGRWIYTPAGLTWVSSEPWGWVPYHYGSWDNLPGYGWVWQPGYVWSPAWVYWYWGPSYVGWCPTGYYTRYYGPEFGGDVGFRFGVYGWAGGGWDLFDHWSFVSTSYFSYQDGYRQGYRDGYWDAHRDVRRYAIPIDRGTRARHRAGDHHHRHQAAPAERLEGPRGAAPRPARPDRHGRASGRDVVHRPHAEAEAAARGGPRGGGREAAGARRHAPASGHSRTPDRRPRGDRSSVFGAAPGQAASRPRGRR